MNSPTGSLGEENVVGVLAGVALDKLDARPILPVAHCHLEEGLVAAAEVGVDVVRDDAVLPNALLARRCRTLRPPAAFSTAFSAALPAAFPFVLPMTTPGKQTTKVLKFCHLILGAKKSLKREATFLQIYEFVLTYIAEFMQNSNKVR